MDGVAQVFAATENARCDRGDWQSRCTKFASEV